MTPLSPADLDDFAFHALSRRESNEWLAIAVPPESIGDVTRELAIKIERRAQTRPASGLVTSAEELKKLFRDGAAAFVIAGIARFTDADWAALDLNRTRLVRHGSVILVLDEETLGRLNAVAPNLATFLSASVWGLSPREEEPPASEGEERLRALRKRFNLSDAEVIARARAGTLPPDPPFAEWLILLGHGDLLGK